MKRYKIFFTLITALAIILTSVITINAASPKLSASKKTITVGKSFTLTLKNVDKKFTWINSNKNVIKVVSVNSKSKSIKLKGIKAGKATITAKIGKTKLTCKITVKPKTEPTEPTVTEETKPTIKEYKLVSVQANHTNWIEEAMNKYAEEGWIVVSTAIYNEKYMYITFERDKIE